jgi:hypothetical protein
MPVYYFDLSDYETIADSDGTKPNAVGWRLNHRHGALIGGKQRRRVLEEAIVGRFLRCSF